MAWSFLILGAVMMGMIGIICGVIDSYGNRKLILPTLISGFAVSFALIVMAFCFTSLKHMVACIKYDNVIVLDYCINTAPSRDIDPDKVIYHEDYSGSYQTYRYVIMAWNDEKPVSQYDKLVQKQ